MRSLIVSVLLVVAALLAVGCAAEDSPSTASTSTSAVAPSAQATTTTLSSTTTAGEVEDSIPEPAFVVTRDVPYMDEMDGWHPPVVDVYAPTADGLLPVVILYHPFPAVNTKTSTSSLAARLAESGFVVFNFNWGGVGSDQPGAEYDFYEATFMAQGPCTYWFAHSQAPQYGGDPSDISLVGFSGGANMVAATAMFGGTQDRGCHADPVEIDPRTAIGFEGDWLLMPWWDDSIAADPRFYPAWTVWDYVDEYEGAPIHLLVDHKTSQGTFYSVNGLGSTVEDFLSLRDSDGTITTDLEAIGALDDGDIDGTEFSELFHYRLEQAGKATSLTWIDDRIHSIGPAAVASIIDLLRAE